ncbi:hypothetical protein MFRU_040g00310 [Monilinia fructicola]|uniref:Uncharacterized protein n=1 Tax=Monilinia fructicola TaxID=38448 RepID=A0A5M9JFD7_MONFR|nr:hypothetical protein EYC84_010469 [Monilinia fructicola]KAG4026472.1 hypothetical protein MFRU_040g00310 [Monilinia fructicola]
MPPIQSQTTCNPDVIATVVYRVIMVFVSLTYIWRKYRQPLRTDDLHQLAELLAVRTSTIQGDSEETRKFIPTEAVDLNNIAQFMLALETVASMELGMDGGGTSVSPSMTLELQQGQT